MSFLTGPPKTLELPEGFRFTHGQTIAPFTIVYETFGELNADRSNAILVCHALSASAHAAGKYTDDPEEKPGWWDGLVGYGKAIDLEKYFVVCVNLPGLAVRHDRAEVDRSRDRQAVRLALSVADDRGHGRVAEARRSNHLGIDASARDRRRLARRHAGADVGGDVSRRARTRSSPWPAAPPCRCTGIAWHILGRKIIESDQRFHGGDYYDHDEPLRGLQVARMLGHMTYLSAQALQRKFGRRRRGNTRQFEIDSYFEYQGKKFAALYDANSYIRVQAAMDEMDLEEQYGNLQSAFARWRGRTLLVSFDTDWLFPPERERARRRGHARARHVRASRADRVGERTRHVSHRLPPDRRARALVSRGR